MTRPSITYRHWAGLVAAVLLLAQSAAGIESRAAIPNDERAIVHTLNRLAFGARPGDVDRIKRVGLAAWIESQLQPGGIANGDLDRRLAGFTTLTLDSATIARDFVAPARMERRKRQQQGQQQGAEPQQPDPAMGLPMRGAQQGGAMNDTLRRGRQVLTELADAKLIRAVYSERQLEEVLVDFWFNHFNVFARKAQTEIYISEYEREAIRPHVLGRFRDLLGATAKSPAMLVYLDNWMSADPDAEKRIANRPRRGLRQAMPNQQPQNPNRRANGLNENYARELLELHTLGVDGGYSQKDVVEVARAFTGWTIGRPGEGGFRFAPLMHVEGPKTILGQTISAGGVADGERVLDLLARHPSTAKHIALKLAQRLVSDTPPPALVDRAARTFETTGGNLREVVRVIITSPEFFAPEAYRAKVKTPFEFVASTLRATAADINVASAAVRALAGLGMPLYLCQPPTGYDETAETWVSSGALVNRLNFALAVAGGEMRGIRLAGLDRLTPADARRAILQDALGGDVSSTTRDTVAKATTTQQIVALAIGSPEFQRQ